MEDFRYRRLAASPRKITEINPEKDVRIRIFGRVIDKSDGTIVVDDGSSTAQIVTDVTCEIDDMVIVFCRVLPLEDGYELRGEIIQNRNNLDMGLYKKVYEEN
ncbi:MAG TPA: hypothetical protein VJB05_04120 [archaeon]|nr:hypothetical protein [archaeon]